jgi:hypothetical protein
MPKKSKLDNFSKVATFIIPPQIPLNDCVLSFKITYISNNKDEVINEDDIKKSIINSIIIVPE